MAEESEEKKDPAPEDKTEGEEKTEDKESSEKPEEKTKEEVKTEVPEEKDILKEARALADSIKKEREVAEKVLKELKDNLIKAAMSGRSMAGQNREKSEDEKVIEASKRLLEGTGLNPFPDGKVPKDEA